MFCGETHRGNCGGQKKVVARATKKPATSPATQPPAVVTELKPSKLDRMRAAATDTWQPTVEAVPRTRAQRIKASAEPEAPFKVERKFTTALDEDTVVLNGAIRALHAANMIADDQLAELSHVLSVHPTIEEELMLWRLQQQAAREEG